MLLFLAAPFLEAPPFLAAAFFVAPPFLAAVFFVAPPFLAAAFFVAPPFLAALFEELFEAPLDELLPAAFFAVAMLFEFNG
ncbi:MAG: hypothetical protein C4330_09470 [Chitinophagaceae bacterium]